MSLKLAEMKAEIYALSSYLNAQAQKITEIDKLAAKINSDSEAFKQQLIEYAYYNIMIWYYQ